MYTDTHTHKITFIITQTCKETRTLLLQSQGTCTQIHTNKHTINTIKPANTHARPYLSLRAHVHRHTHKITLKMTQTRKETRTPLPQPQGTCTQIHTNKHTINTIKPANTHARPYLSLRAHVHRHTHIKSHLLYQKHAKKYARPYLSLRADVTARQRHKVVSLRSRGNDEGACCICE